MSGGTGFDVSESGPAELQKLSGNLFVLPDTGASESEHFEETHNNR
jgi:hypothetical protein